MAFSDILLECDLLDQITLNQLADDPRTSAEGVLRAALRHGVLDENRMLKVFSKRFRLPILDIKKLSIPMELLQAFPLIAMVEKCFLPIALKGLPGKENLIVALVDPSDESLQKDIERRAQKPVKFGLALPSQIWAILEENKVGVPREKNLAGEDSEITELTHQPRSGLHADDDDEERMLAALTEPTQHGFRVEKTQAKGDLQQVLREGNKTAMLEGVIDLLIQKKVFTLEEFLAALELKK